MAVRISVAIIIAVALAVVSGAIGLRVAALARETDARLKVAPSTGRFVTAGDLDLFVQEAGPVDGAPVLLIPAPGAWSETWRASLNALGRAGFHAIAVDLPPFGYSFRPPNADYSTVAQAARVSALMDALSAAPVIVVAHSVNARAAIEVAMAKPERVRALVLAAPALALHAPITVEVSPLTRFALEQSVLRETLVASTATNPWATRLLLSMAAARPEAMDASVAAFQQPMKLTGTTEAVGRWLRSFRLSEEFPASRNVQRYRALAVPTLLLWGERDEFAPPEQGEALAKLMPAALLRLMPNVGHWPQLEDERNFNTLMLSWLGGLPPLTAPASPVPPAAVAPTAR